MSSCTLELPHLVHLAGLMRDRPFELGPAPTENPAEWRETIVEHLREANLVVANGGELTDYAHSLLDPLIDYEEAYWGMLLLHNEHQPVTFEISNDWLAYLRDTLVTAAVTSPRVYFLLTRSAENVMTCAVRVSNRVHLTQYTTNETTFPADAARFLTGVADPEGIWGPTSLAPISVPYDLLSDPASVPSRGPAANADNDTKASYARTTRAWISTLAQDGRIDTKTLSRVQTMMGYDHVASMQISHSAGPKRMTPVHNAVVDYFHGHGAAVTRPRQMADGRLWRQISPATPSTVGKSLAALRDLPKEPRDYLVTVSDSVDTDAVLESVIPKEMVDTIEAIKRQTEQSPREAGPASPAGENQP